LFNTATEPTTRIGASVTITYSATDKLTGTVLNVNLTGLSIRIDSKNSATYTSGQPLPYSSGLISENIQWNAYP
jgi:hypothetical protein